MIPYNPAQQITSYVRFQGGPNARDTFERSGATALAAEIDAWWHRRGYPQVRHWIEEAGVKNSKRIWVIRGNLIAGIPPQVDEKAEAA